MTARVRRAIQHSQESLRALAKHYCINPKTVAKWKKRTSTTDRKTGPTEPKSTLLPLDDCLYALQPTIPHLTRSSLYRCLQCHGISRLPDVDGDKPSKKTFKAYPIGFFDIDIAEVKTAEGKLHQYVGIGRTPNFAFDELVEKADTATARAFLAARVVAVPYKVKIVLTDNGIQLTNLPRNRSGPTAMWRGHPFDRACQAHGIEHRLTKPKHPWTTGQVKRID